MMGRISKAMLAVYWGLRLSLLFYFHFSLIFMPVTKVIGGENCCVRVYYTFRLSSI